MHQRTLRAGTTTWHTDPNVQLTAQRDTGPDVELQTIGRSSLAKLLRISPSTLDRMRADGTFTVRPIAMFGRPLWSRAAVARWLGGDPAMPDGDYSLLTLAEVAKLLAVSRATAYRLRSTQPFSAIQVCVGQEARYPRCALRTILQAA